MSPDGVVAVAAAAVAYALTLAGCADATGAGGAERLGEATFSLIGSSFGTRAERSKRIRTGCLISRST